jgi:hypothetical protein
MRDKKIEFQRIVLVVDLESRTHCNQRDSKCGVVVDNVDIGESGFVVPKS